MTWTVKYTADEIYAWSVDAGLAWLHILFALCIGKFMFVFFRCKFAAKRNTTRFFPPDWPKLIYYIHVLCFNCFIAHLSYLYLLNEQIHSKDIIFFTWPFSVVFRLVVIAAYNCFHNISHKKVAKNASEKQLNLGISPNHNIHPGQN